MSCKVTTAQLMVFVEVPSCLCDDGSSIIRSVYQWWSSAVGFEDAESTKAYPPNNRITTARKLNSPVILSAVPFSNSTSFESRMEKRNGIAKARSHRPIPISFFIGIVLLFECECSLFTEMGAR